MGRCGVVWRVGIVVSGLVPGVVPAPSPQHVPRIFLGTFVLEKQPKERRGNARERALLTRNSGKHKRKNTKMFALNHMLVATFCAQIIR